MWSGGIQYEDLELLGEGGQGRVFKALRIDKATGLSTTVALKILHSETAVELWKKEFESLRRVRSNYCVQVLAFDRVRRKPALVLEYVDGVSLSHLGRSSCLDENDVREIGLQIEAGLLDLQKFAMVHGDLSPANVLVARDGGIKLLDFGLANLAGPQVRVTPDFASPFRLAGDPPLIRDDLFSLRRIESFLLGRPIPDCLDFSTASPTDLGRRKLARKVDDFLRRRRWRQRFKTSTHQILLSSVKSPWRIPLGPVAALVLLLLNTSSANSRVADSWAVAKISIRTVYWYEIQVNGQPVGYSPVDLVVAANSRLSLGWKNARGTGHRQLQLAPGQHLLLGDRDLTRRVHAGTSGAASHIRDARGRANEGPSN